MSTESSSATTNELKHPLDDARPSHSAGRDISVAVLLATHNCERYVEQQIKSLAENKTRFTLHWLDDHSIDGTRRTVKSTARQAGIELVEQHHPAHLGLPNSFFQLLDSVEADIYLFCDQDDVWQRGKIDAAVDDLVRDIEHPILTFSDSILFYENEAKPRRRLSDVIGRRGVRLALRSPPMFQVFTRAIAAGHTQAFTRSVRDVYLRHREIARQYAFMHDWWMHDITIMFGTSRMLIDAPTALWRQHSVSFTSKYALRATNIVQRWNEVQRWRHVIARHTLGLVLCIPSLPDGAHKERLFRLGQLLSNIHRRQSPLQILKILRNRAVPRNFHVALMLVVACLFSDAQTTEVPRLQ